VRGAHILAGVFLRATRSCREKLEGQPLEVLNVLNVLKSSLDVRVGKMRCDDIIHDPGYARCASQALIESLLIVSLPCLGCCPLKNEAQSRSYTKMQQRKTHP